MNWFCNSDFPSWRWFWRMQALYAIGGASGMLTVLAIGAALTLTGCEDKAYPLDCLNACGHQLD